MKQDDERLQRIILDDAAPAYLFKDYEDDDIREPLVNFGERVGAEEW